MNQLIVNFADLKIKIHTNYDYMFKFCKDYIIDKTEFDFEVYPSEGYQHKMDDNPLFSEAYCESISLYEEIGKKLPFHNAFIMHGATITYQDKGLMFTAKSGTGKSTHIKLWKKHFGKDVDIINGDKPIVRVFEDGIKVYGTPYCGKECWHKNRSAYLHSVCIVQRGTTNKIRRIPNEDAILPLYQQIFLPKDNEEVAGKILDLYNQFLTLIPIYVLQCNISEEAVQVAYEGMLSRE